MQDEVHPGLIKMVNKMLEEATSSDNESDYINTRLKNDIIVYISYKFQMVRNKLKNIT